MFLCLFLFSCVHPQSRLSFGDFNDQVLELLASRIAYEQVEHAKSEVMRAYAERERKIAEGRPGSTEKQLLSALGAWVGGPVGFSLMEGLFNLDDSEFQKNAVLREKHRDEILAWLDRKVSLKQEIFRCLSSPQALSKTAMQLCGGGHAAIPSCPRSIHPTF